jgi:hypothetical protein
MIDIMSELESVRFPLSPVPNHTATQTHAHTKPPLSPIRSELSYSSNGAIEVFMPKSPTSIMDVRLLYLKDYKLQNVQLKARLREVPSAISFSSIHFENIEETPRGDACSSYTQDNTSVTSAEMEEDDDLLGFSYTYTQDESSVEIEEEDDLLGLDLILDDDEEEDFDLDEMEAEAR